MRFLVLFAVLLSLVGVVRGQDQVWALTDGRTVAVSKVLSQSPTHVTVRCAEGLLQIDKRQLPPEIQAKYPYDGEAAAAVQLEQEQDKARREALAARERALVDSQRQWQRQQQPQPQMAVRILSARSVGPALAYVTIENRSADAVEVGKDSFICVTVVGASFPSVRLTNPRGDMLRKVRIAAGETAEVAVVFNIPPDQTQDVGSVRFR